MVKSSKNLLNIKENYRSNESSFYSAPNLRYTVFTLTPGSETGFTDNYRLTAIIYSDPRQLLL
jgi:hypothetical protein